MKYVGQLLLGVLIILLLLSGLPITEGWSSAVPDAGATYDIWAGQNTLISNVPAPQGTTSAAFVNYMTTDGTSSASDFTTVTGLTLDTSTGVVSGTTGAAVTVDGVFNINFIISGVSTPQYIKIKIDTPHDTANNIGVPGGGSGGWSGPQFTGEPAPGVNSCGQVADIGSCGVTETATSACERMSAKKEAMAVELERVTTAANVRLAEIARDTPERAADIIAAQGHAASEMINGVAQFTPFGALSAAIHETGETVRDGDIFSGKVEAIAHINNIFQSNISESDTSKSQAACISESSNTYLNNLSVNAVCNPETMHLSEANFTTLALAERIGPYVNGVNQSIINSATSKCVQNATLKNITDSMNLVDATATNAAVADLEGTGTIQSNTDGCNEQVSNKDTCTYLSNQQCCSDVRKDVMQNLLEVSSCFAHVDDVDQTINITTNASCGVTANDTIDVTSLSVVETDESNEASNSQSPNPIYMYALIAGTLMSFVFAFIYMKSNE